MDRSAPRARVVLEYGKGSDTPEVNPRRPIRRQDALRYPQQKRPVRLGVIPAISKDQPGLGCNDRVLVIMGLNQRLVQFRNGLAIVGLLNHELHIHLAQALVNGENANVLISQ